MTSWNRRLAAVVAVAVIAFAGFACADDGGEADNDFDDNPTPIEGVSTPSSFPVEFQRSDGQTLTVDEPVTRIVSLSPGATEMIYAIGAQDALIAVDNNANYPPEVASLSGRVDAYQPNVEAIAGFEPDLVIVANDVDGIVEALDRLSIPVLYVDLDTDVKTLDAVFGQIGLLGRLTAHEEAAQALLVDLRTRVRAIEDVMQALASQDAPTYYHELDAELYSISNDTFIGNVYRVLKARNIAGDGGGIAYPQMTQEAIIEANPDVIVLADEAFGVTVESVRARPGWSAISAVENDRIYTIDPDIISRPGPRIVDALEELARQLYPQAFE
jgi:iron complex transport system substrate-binding protein